MPKKWKVYEEARIMVLLLIAMGIFFMTFLWVIDISVSTLFLRAAGYEVSMQGLFTKNAEPRVMYHIALLVLIEIFFIMSYMIICSKWSDKNGNI